MNGNLEIVTLGPIGAKREFVTQEFTCRVCKQVKGVKVLGMEVRNEGGPVLGGATCLECVAARAIKLD